MLDVNDSVCVPCNWSWSKHHALFITSPAEEYGKNTIMLLQQ